MHKTQIRRPRFERTSIRHMILTPRDLDILRAIYRYRFLHSIHLATLSGGSQQAILRRLQLLFHHGYLDRPPMQLDWYTKGSEPMVYALGRRGAEVLEAEGQARRGGVRWDAKNRHLSRLFLHHTLAVAEVMVAFEVACRDRDDVQFIPSEEVLSGAPEPTRRLPFRWQIEVRHSGKLHRLGVEPDRVFGLRFKGRPEGRQSAFFFLEVDRGTMPVVRRSLAQTSFFRKLLAYQETWLRGLHKSRLAMPNFRVLSVTTSGERVQHLIGACRSLPGIGSQVFLFADYVGLRRDDILEQEWVSGRGKLVRLTADLPSEGLEDKVC